MHNANFFSILLPSTRLKHSY